MRQIKLFVLSVFVLTTNVVDAQRIRRDFNQDWKFIQADSKGFAEEGFKDSEWRKLNVPHDWAFENGIRPGGAQKQGGGYHDGGIAWYRKTFEVAKESLSKTVYICFDGVYMNSEVWVNGSYLGKRPYGYISFRYDISDKIKVGENSIAVRVDNKLEPSARWYHPCGIYAPVELVEVYTTHISPNGIFITTPVVSEKKALVNAKVNLTTSTNQKNVKIKASILSPEGKILSSVVEKVDDQQKEIPVNLNVEYPKLWSPESPELYVFVTQVVQGKKVVDEVRTNFGFRTMDWKTETGFWLNGKNVKLKGVCEHWEGGPVAGAWTKPMLRWKLQLIKDMGMNAIRPSHNPCPPMFYDICDEIGLLVLDEVFDGWHKKAPFDYGKQAFDEWWQRDVTEWITRNRNHPSIFAYSLGNETHSDLAPELIEFCQQLDSTRLYTSGSGNSDDFPLIGINGGSENKTFIENANFDRPFISTEAPHTWQTRGHYRTQTWWRDNERKGTYPLPDLTEKEIFFYDWADPKKWKNRKQRLNSSYDNATVRISARKNWEVMRDLPWHSGHFRWTGFDYYGESGLVHGGYPFNLFMGGALDVAGFKKDLFYFYQSQWTEEPMLHVLPSWTHPRMEKGTKIPVWVYSNTDEVELFLNGKSLGKDAPGTKWDEMQCEWLVPYEPGKLEAVAYIGDKEVKRVKITTSKQPVKLQNSLEKLESESGFEACYILTSEGVDSKGELFPYAENMVNYSIRGDIEKISLENGNPVDATSRAKANYRSLFMGKTRAYLKEKKNAQKASVVVGSILGDKPLYLSKDVAIHVEEIHITGKSSDQPFEILYTTNGEDPLAKGKTYSKPFEVNDGETVNAVVKQGNEIVLKMTESFGKDLGLFWGDEHSEDVWIGRGITIPAETAMLEGGAKPSKNARRYKSDGIVVFNNEEGAIVWYKENDGDPGEYNIRIRYTHNDASSLRPMTLIVNDEVVEEFEFKPTGSWEQYWRFVSAKITFKSGANHIELRTKGESGPHIDELMID